MHRVMRISFPLKGVLKVCRGRGPSIHTLEAATGRLLSTVDTADLPDGLVFKACGTRRASVCPA